MSRAPSFIVIDYHAESRYLLVKTLRRKFPGAVVHESDDAEKAIEIARAVNLSAIITHRTFEIMVSGIDRSAAAKEAGASGFLSYDEWLRIGSVVEAHLRAPDASPASDETAVA